MSYLWRHAGAKRKFAQYGTNQHRDRFGMVGKAHHTGIAHVEIVGFGCTANVTALGFNGRAYFQVGSASWA